MTQQTQDETNISQPTQGFFTRLGSWFRRGQNEGLDGSQLIDSPHSTAIETRTSFLRPWARRDAAINQLHEGFHTLTDLMSTVRDNLERQNRRQEELVQYLSHLPEALASLPESNRMHGEALRAIHQQLENQNSQQLRLAEILEKLNTKGLEDREVLEEVRERVETMRQTDQAIAENLHSVGTAMQTINKNSNTSACLLYTSDAADEL